MQFRCTLPSSANVSSSPRFIDCGSALVLLDLHSFRCFRITRCTHHADSWSQLRSIAPESMHPPRASDTRNTLKDTQGALQSYLERRRASRGQKLIRPADLISWEYSHHDPQHILHCVAPTAALPWLCGTQLKGPAGVDLGPVWLLIYPRSIPTGVETMPGSATAAAEEPQRSCHKVATFDVLLQGLLELWEHFEVRLVGFVQGLSGRELRQGTRLQALLEPLLYCSRWMHPLGAPTACSAPVLPWACRTSLPTKGKHNTFSKTHATHFSHT